MFKPYILLIFALLGFCKCVEAADNKNKLIFEDGDRVLLIGDVLIERECNYGIIETKMRREFPGVNFAVRNLGYSGDTPLGASRASFDPVSKGLNRLIEQLEVVKPTVAIIGYGMAASLEEITYRHNDPTLNPDPSRYGTEHTPSRLKREVAQLMELILKHSPNGKVRFVILGPIVHEDLRSLRPNLPDPEEHNKILKTYETELASLAKEKNAIFIHANWSQYGISLKNGTENGIHLTELGYRALSEGIADQLGWHVDRKNWHTPTSSTEILRNSILRKNSLFFHRSRPANYTYIFGFRSREQGKNAIEIPKFDPLIEKAEAEVIAISSGKSISLPAEPATTTPLVMHNKIPVPEFTLTEGLQISLFAENPLLEKPVHMNWDSEGRLWVATSNTYPQINPEDIAGHMAGESSKYGPSTGNDKLILLIDNNHDGIADESRIVADKLLIPSGVAPDNRGGAYVGASTELLHLSKPNESGMLSQRRIVLSGFGTEDTHHIIHTLHWGIDGRLYFHQTIYIHSHIETPWGLVRANSGAVFAYNPENERLEVYSKGLVNAWGQQEDVSGQTFLTSGADNTGIHWAFPGAVFPPSEGARRLIGSISPGAYPKFSGLELINSPLFDDDWQGNAVTCDFRAHRIVRFSINDTSKLSSPLSGYVTKELPDVVRTSDVAFRPITAKLGPDGALYVADWTNPIINHGEVDFRDPRRDKFSGRIWRISPTNSKTITWKPVQGRSIEQLLVLLLSANRWEFEQARRELSIIPIETLLPKIKSWANDDQKRRHSAWLLSGRTHDTSIIAELLRSDESTSLQVGLRELGKSLGSTNDKKIQMILPLLIHTDPRVKLEAYRALARIRSIKSSQILLEKLHQNHQDTFLDFAAWTTINDLAPFWLNEITKKPLLNDDHEKSLNVIVQTIDPSVASPYVQKLFVGRSIDSHGTGPWIELVGKAGTTSEASLIFNTWSNNPRLNLNTQLRIARSLGAAATRNVIPQGDLMLIGKFLTIETDRSLLIESIRLTGLWKLVQFVPQLSHYAGIEKDNSVRQAAINAIRIIGQQASISALRNLTAETSPAIVRRDALPALAVHAPKEALKVIPSIFRQINSNEEAAATWLNLFQLGSFAQQLSKEFPKGLSSDHYAAALKSASSLGRNGAELVKILEPLTGNQNRTRNHTAEIKSQLESIKRGADPSEGEIHYRKNGCALCHAIGGAGGKFGPDLSSIGASAPIDYIIESVINPAAKVKEGYHGFSYKMKDGSQMVGIPTRESASELYIRPSPGVEISLIKAHIISRENIGSIMPASLTDGLTGVERRNLYSFLSELGKPGLFDASKSNVARIWKFGDQPPGALAQPSTSSQVYTLVNGQLPKVFFPNQHYATSQFTNATTTTKPLILNGIKSAWIDNTPLKLKNGIYLTPILPGNHILTVEVDVNAPYLKAQCDDFSFIGD